jgi:hypothetical protein
MRAFWCGGLALALLASCRDRSEGNCGVEEGTVSGTVSGVTGLTQVALYAADGEVVALAVPDETGHFSVTAAPGDYVLAASSQQDISDTGGLGFQTCYSVDVSVTITKCEETTADLSLTDCETADKPNLYLYPSKDTPTTVRLVHDPRQVVFASEPTYEGAWTGVAHPDGTFTTAQGEIAPFLFYEITLLPAQGRTLQHSQSVCVGGANAVGQMADLLAAYGFTDREQADFVVGWETDLPWRASYRVYPQRSVDAVVRVDIQPALPLERVWLLVEDGAGCVPASALPVPTPLARSGAHAVEWGVVLRGLR